MNKTRSLIAAATVTAAGLFVLIPSVAQAHHQLIDVSASCTDAGWSATYTVTADADRALTWSVNGEPAQADEVPFVFVIPMTLADSSSTFHAEALWSNGTTDSDDAGIDQPSGCTVATTTTTEVLPSTTSTTTSSTTTSTTVAPTTSTPTTVGVTSTTTTEPTTSSSVAATSTTSTTPAPTSSVTTTASTVPPAPSSTTPVCDAPPGTESDAGCILPPPFCEPVLIDVNSDGDFDDANENSCQTGFLPATT